MSREALFLAIDLGTSRCKVALVDTQGNVQALEAIGYGLKSTGEGELLQDPDAWWQALITAARAVMRGRVGRRVRLVTLTGQGTSAVCLDSQGRVLHPVVLPYDKRLRPYLPQIQRRFGEVGFLGSRMFPYLLWLKDSGGDLGRIKYVLDVREYIAFLLTGRPSYDSTAITGDLLDEFSRHLGLDPQVFGAPHDDTHPIGPLTRRAAQLLGLPGSTHVLIAPFDGLASTIGSGVVEPGLVGDVAGSTEVLAAPLPAASGSGTISYRGELRLFLKALPLGFAFDWLKERLYRRGVGGGSHTLMAREAARIRPGADGLIYLPTAALDDPTTPMAGHFLNLQRHHERAHMARAIMEGVAYTVRRILDEIRGFGVGVAQVRLSGGGAASGLWNQIRADIFGVDVALPQTTETGCLGAAMAGALSLGVYSDLRQACRAMVRIRRVYRPRGECRGYYEGGYRMFLALARAWAQTGSTFISGRIDLAPTSP